MNNSELYLLDVKVSNIKLQDTDIIHGLPSLFIFHGFLKNLEIKYNKVTNQSIKINRFLPFFKIIQVNEGRKSKSNDFIQKAMYDNVKGYFEGTIVFDITHDEKFDQTTFYYILKKLQLGNGFIFNVYLSNFNKLKYKRIIGWYPLISNKKETFLDIILEQSISKSKGLLNIMRTGEEIVADLDKSTSQYNKTHYACTPIYSLIEFKMLKKELNEELFFKKSFIIIKNNNLIQLKQGN